MLFNPISILDKFFKRADEDYVVLDLGAAYLKGLFLSHSEIKDFFVVENKGSPVKLAADELRKRGWPGKKVRVAIKGNDTLIRYITFPKVDSKNIWEIFSYEISKFVPFKKEDIYFDVFILIHWGAPSQLQSTGFPSEYAAPASRLSVSTVLKYFFLFCCRVRWAYHSSAPNDTENI